MADLQRVQQAIQSISASTGARLNARANGDLVEIHGTVRSIAEKQHVMRAITQAVGDIVIKNMIQVATDSGRPPQQQPATASQPGRGGPAIGMTSATEIPATRTHKVAKGETLSHIAQRYFGKASEYNRIFEANRDQLKDPDKIREGMELKIPG
jgi:nucleoid-associated protein YgaU